MNRTGKIVLIAAVVLLALLLAAAGFGYKVLLKRYSHEQAKAAQSAVRSAVSAAGSTTASYTTAPDFSVEDEQGRTVTFSKFLGKPVVLNFWASWCPPCQREMPAYQKIYERYRKTDVQFVMIDLTDGSRETVATAKQFLSKNGYTFPAYFDVNAIAADAYGILSIPDSYFIDRSGLIRAAYSGSVDEASIEKSIEQILK